MMKKIVFVAAGLSLATLAQAQQNMLGCMDASLRVQAEQVKRDLKPQGFVSIRDMMITMKSKEAVGVPVVLTQGKLHQLVFIGSKEASNMHFELYDKAKFRIDERKFDNPSESNLLIYSIVPETTDTFMVALTQNLKTKSACGSFTILRQDEKPQAAPTTKPGKAKPAASKPKKN
ncbi:hypothetical protein [Polluticoccus soli]|uniref:hypothetical protein n=1 Tax=Polluticoccus soli TaxID=3034150 RepID=UPI0023E24ADC|nr:hypothetical protein [Flavipsychrobacter sp. JY13-12]